MLEYILFITLLRLVYKVKLTWTHPQQTPQPLCLHPHRTHLLPHQNAYKKKKCEQWWEEETPGIVREVQRGIEREDGR